MSIAILPMSAEFNWNPATVGLIQSSFFWGYLLTQVTVTHDSLLHCFYIFFTDISKSESTVYVTTYKLSFVPKA